MLCNTDTGLPGAKPGGNDNLFMIDDSGILTPDSMELTPVPSPEQVLDQPDDLVVILMDKLQAMEDLQTQQKTNHSHLKKCFSHLKTNYLNVCKAYNSLLEKFHAAESERVELKLENDQLKEYLEGALHELNILRAKERKALSKGDPGLISQKLRSIS